MVVQYVGIRVTDLARSLRFYQEALGLREVHRGDLSQYGRGSFVLLEDPKSHQRIELNWYPAPSEFATAYLPGEGLDHIGVLVDDLPKAEARLRAAGARPTSVTLASTGGHQICLLDPDDNWIELFGESAAAPPPRATARTPPRTRPAKRRTPRGTSSRRT